MKKNSKRLLLTLTLLITTITSPLRANADICDSVARDFYYDTDSKIDNSFFDRYLIGKKDGRYFIYAIKTVNIDFKKLVDTFNNPEKYPEFMLGYNAIKVKKVSDSLWRTSIHFTAPLPLFLKFDSVFTNNVEIQDDMLMYKQCWQQLAEDDKDRLEDFKNAPHINRGYWQLVDLGNHKTTLEYHSIIKPPVSLPLFIYRFFVKNSYVETFQRIIDRAKKTGA